MLFLSLLLFVIHYAMRGILNIKPPLLVSFVLLRCWLLHLPLLLLVLTSFWDGFFNLEVSQFDV